MPTYHAPLKDLDYLFNDVFDIQKYANLKGFEDATPDLIRAILEEGAKLAEDVLQPLNRTGDIEGCTLNDDHSVTTPSGFKDAYKMFTEGGWQGLSHDPNYGGQGLPYVLGAAMEEIFVSANQSFNMYPGLTSGAIACITLAGSDDQKKTYLPNMISGKWSGTMNLTESHCGTDLGMMRSKAVPQDDGTFRITGQKIFISAGEHDLTENIIHLVLAKIPGGPEGVKGISLFIVPKYLVNDDGTLGERNGVTCGSIEEKMGIHGNSTCVLNYDDAVGYLVGEEHKGLSPMFIMMNAARLGVGIQGLAISEVAYQNAVVYAKDRLQGRSISGVKNADGPADPIIVHPDVRRMLLDSRAFNEGARALALYAGLKVDMTRRAPDEEERTKADNELGLLTPVIKAYFTDNGYKSATNAQQIYGGHGYIKEWGMEQFVRDARINMIYEGANGIQALDLVGRKLPKNGGQAIREYFETINTAIADNDDDSLALYRDGLKTALGHLQKATMWLMENGMKNPDNAGAASTPYLNILALVAMGHMWLLMAATSTKALANGGDKDFHTTKLQVGQYFIKRILPETADHLAKIEAGSEIMMDIPAEAF